MSIFPANVIYQSEITYISGEIKTKDLGLSTEKDALGEGLTGFVHVSKQNSDIVIKKSVTTFILNEQRIGLKIEHPNFMKVGRVFKKMYPASESEGKTAYNLYKLELEKIDGQTINEFFFNELVGREFYLKLTATFVNAIVFLNKKEIAWGDVNTDNVMVNKSGHIKFIDYGFYEEEPDVDKRVECLLREYRNFTRSLADYKMHRDAKVINWHVKKWLSIAVKSLSKGQNSSQTLDAVLAHIGLYLNSL